MAFILTTFLSGIMYGREFRSVNPVSLETRYHMFSATLVQKAARKRMCKWKGK
jgi:hypothetical protein